MHLKFRLKHSALQKLGRQHIICWWRASWSIGLFATAVVCSVLLITIGTDRTRSLLVKLRPEPNLTLSAKLDIAVTFPLKELPLNIESVPVTKKIHFMYKGYSVDASFVPLLSSWRAVYPDYRMYFWTDAEIDLLISRRYRTWRDMYYKQLSNYMERSDTARAFVLHAMGGWYADLDTGCLSRADRHTSRHALILPLEPYLHALNNFRMPRLVSNAIMYSVPEHPFWLFYLQQLKQFLISQKPRESTIQAPYITGPVLLTRVALKFQEAHQGVGCPGVYCPHLPSPVKFLPIYDNGTLEMSRAFRRLCETHIALQVAGFADECERFKPHNYLNYPLDPAESHTFHAFIHLNQRAQMASAHLVDVCSFGMQLLHGQNIVSQSTS